MMADEDAPKEGTEGENDGNEQQVKKSKLPWILLGIIIPFCAVGGFFLGRIVAAGREVPAGPGVAEEKSEEADYVKLLNTKAKETNTWIFEVPPVVANLMDPGARRFLRVSFSLEMSGQFDQAGGETLMKEDMPKIKNWIMIYFADLDVSQLQGERNLKRVLAQVKDGLNDLLFPGVKPLIVNVLFSERAIQ